MSRLPLSDPPRNVRQRELANGDVRLWWEPSAAARKLGFGAVQLDAARLTWSVREAGRLNDELARAIKAGRRETRTMQGSRTIAALIDDYLKSRLFARKAAKTQDSYRKQLAIIARKWGEASVLDFSKPVMHQWYETLLEQTSEYTAIARLRHMSMLFAHAELIGWRPEGSNPCSKLKMSVPKGRRRVVTWAEFDALVQAARDLGLHSIETAIVLGMFQGQRQTDIRLATCGAFQRRRVQMLGWPEPRLVWTWQLTRSKRGNEGAMVIHHDAVPALEAALAAAKLRLYRQNGSVIREDEFAAAPLLADEGYGDASYAGPRAEFRFQTRWDKVRSSAVASAEAAGQHQFAAALAEIQYRDLRRSFGVHSRAGGASKDDAADVLGNSAATDQMLGDIYMAPSFETASRAVMAVHRPKTEDTQKKA